MPLSTTQLWLKENSRFYSNPHSVYADSDAFLARFPQIRPKTDIYTYDDGRSQLLLCLHGTLPITYRQATYNIPVAIWVTRDYPREHPIAYVVAAPDMLIRASQSIDLSGRCNIEYIQNWKRKSEGCSLIGLAEAMQGHFSKEPPVYAKPKEAPNPPTSPTSPTHYSAKPPPPLPGSQPQPLQQPEPSPNTPLSSAPSPPHTTAQPITDHTDRPALPPKPSTSSGPIPTSPPQIQQSAYPQIWDPPRQTPSPPFHHPLPTHYQSMQVTANPTSSQPGYYMSQPPPPPPPPSLTSPIATTPPPPSIYPSLAQIQLQTTQPVPPPPPPVPPPPSQIYPKLHDLVNQQIAQPPQPLRSPPPNLMDADDQVVSPPPVPGHAPPRPPNPELLQLHAQIQDKLTSEFSSLSQAMALDSERLRAHQADLLTGEPAIRDEMARLEAVRDVCRGVSERLRHIVTQGEANVADLRNKGDPPVDELLCSTTIVHNQLIDLIAEDNAIEDTMYHLHRALNAGRIDLERFLRVNLIASAMTPVLWIQTAPWSGPSFFVPLWLNDADRSLCHQTTRTLAEEQFMKRALIEKIQVQAPIGGWA